ncbi:ATP-binding protein [Desulfobacter postgatei]|uniref:ATP-binding protein n=1 Tax=Desulfobacter postgatei TaxID=2293 RepID=UPI00259B05B4|nr:ATP-binding protein [uncultured Desulfobacter sp.]
MFDTSPDGILKIIREGESATVEFKSKLPPADVIARVFAAFANTKGGILLVGVTDDGSVCGVQKNEIEPSIDRLQRITSSLLGYPVQISVIDIQGKPIIYAVVNAAPQHFGPILSSKGEFLKRNGSQIIAIPGSSIKGALRQFVETIKEENKKELKIFVAMSFRDEEEPALEDYYRAMKRAVDNTKMPIVLRRMDLIDGDFEISQQIMKEIDSSDAMIADFTLTSRNVYFELGYARGKDIRVIQTARKGTSLEFDIRNWKTIFYRNATELEEKLIPEFQSVYKEFMERKS